MDTWPTVWIKSWDSTQQVAFDDFSLNIINNKPVEAQVGLYSKKINSIRNTLKSRKLEWLTV